MVIFGAGGDLTKRLVTPALYNLVTAKRLPDGFRLVGVDRTPGTVEEWRDNLTKMMDEFVTKGGGEFQADHIDQKAWRWLTDRMIYLQGDFTDPQAYRQLKAHLAGLDKTAANHLFYLAVPDRFFGTIVAALGKAEMVTEAEGKWRRVV
ncbi:MAG TPA: glucose-6-phosphate dehydrogenase, partial [Reyranella sp.]